MKLSMLTILFIFAQHKMTIF